MFQLITKLSQESSRHTSLFPCGSPVPPETQSLSRLTRANTHNAYTVYVTHIEIYYYVVNEMIVVSSLFLRPPPPPKHPPPPFPALYILQHGFYTTLPRPYTPIKYYRSCDQETHDAHTAQRLRHDTPTEQEQANAAEYNRRDNPASVWPFQGRLANS